MPGLPLQAAPPTWAVQNFATIELSDVRRVRRIVTVAQAMATQPGRGHVLRCLEKGGSRRELHMRAPRTTVDEKPWPNGWERAHKMSEKCQVLRTRTGV
jgi:hypothetical protein